MCHVRILLTFLIFSHISCSHLFPFLNTPNNNKIQDKTKSLNIFKELKNLIFSHIASVPNSLANPCTLSFLDYFKDPLTNQALINTAMGTGKKLNDLGDYRACKNGTATKYILLENINFRLGLCLPYKCNENTIEPLKPVLISAINLVSGPYKIHMNDTKFIDVEKQNHELTKITLGSIIFLILISGIIIITIIATTYEYYYKNQDTVSDEISLLSSFSLQTNVPFTLNSQQNTTDPLLSIFNGVKFIALFWAMCGNTYIYDNLAPTYNFPKFKHDLLNSFNHSFVKTATLAGDVFFFISGFFAISTFYKVLKEEQNRSIKIVIFAYLRRYFRQLPLLIIAILGLVFLLPYLRDRPIHPKVVEDMENCKNKPFWTLLFMNNLIKPEDGCLNWTWWISADFQFYIIAPFLALPFLFSYSLGMVVLLGGGAISMCITSFIYSHFSLHTSFSKPMSDNYYTEFYIKPYCRVIPYLLGAGFNFMYQDFQKLPSEKHCRPFFAIQQFVSKHEYAKYLFYFMGISIAYASIHTISFFDTADSWPQELATLYEVAFRPLFVIGLMMVIYPSIIGQGEALSEILGHPMFGALSKFTYGAYLINPIILYSLVGYSLSAHFINHSWMLFNLAIITIGSYVISFVLTVIFECPMIHFLRKYIDPIRKPISNTQINKTNQFLTKDE